MLVPKIQTPEEGGVDETQVEAAETATLKHAQLSALLRESAAALGPGAALPSERALMAAHSVSRATVRRAIADLVHEGVLERRHGQGTYVSRPKVQTHLHLASFTEDMVRRGRVPSTQLLGLALLDTPEDVAEALDGAARAWRVERLRLADDEPMAYELQWIDQAAAPNLGAQDLRGSIYEILRTQYGRPIDGAEQTLWAEPATPRMAQLLGIGTGMPVLVFDRTSSSGGRPLEKVWSWYRADRYRVHMDLGPQESH